MVCAIVLSLLISKNVSGVPVLDDSGKVLNCYCRTDVVFLAKDTRGGMLDRSVGVVLEEQVGASVFSTSHMTTFL